MIDSIMLIIVGLVGILTPFLILSFGLALIVVLYGVLNVTYNSLISARHNKQSQQPLKEVIANQARPQCPKEETAHGPIPDCRIAA